MSGLRQRPGQGGVALVVTLMMMSVLTMMVVGLSGVMRNEQAAARNLTYRVLAEQMAEIGAREAMATLLSNSPVGATPSVTGPGWMMTNGLVVSLFSSNTNGQTVNLEAVGNKSLILSQTSPTSRIEVQWNNIPAPGTNPNAIGRYAWWVDDEGAKASLNAVGSDINSFYLPLMTNFPISGNFLFPNPNTGAIDGTSTNAGQALRARTNAIFTTESIKDISGIGPVAFNRAKGHVTAWPSTLQLTPWGTPRINLADPGLTTAQIKAAMTTNAWAGFFGNTLANKYGDLLLDQIAANIKGMAGAPVSNSYASNFVNLDTNRHRQNLPQTAVSQHPGPYLNMVRLMVDQKTSANSATARLSIGVQVFNPNLLDLSGISLEVRLRKMRFSVAMDPTNSANSANRTNVTLAAGTGPIKTVDLFVTDYQGRFWIGPEWNESGSGSGGDLHPFPIGSSLTANLSGKNRFSESIVSQTLDVAFGAGLKVGSFGSNAFVMLDQVLLKKGGQVMDWVSFDDFSQPGNDSDKDDGQVEVAAQTWQGDGPVANMVGTDGLWKTDPQVRFPNSMWDGTKRGSFTTNGLPAGFSAKAWKKISDPFDCTSTNGSVTGISYLWPDPVNNETTLNSHPHFVSGYFTTNGIKSVAQLGAIHTGLPWRTLRFQPTSSNELAQGPPDWILLDLFTVAGANQTFPRVNVNGVPRHSAGVLTNQSAIRRWPTLAAMGTASQPVTGDTNTLAANGVPVTLTSTSAVYSNLLEVGTNLATALTNSTGPAGWATNSRWAAVRSNLPSTNLSVFPSNGFALTGEILEVRGIADGSEGEDVIEGRLRSFLDLLTTRSDTFTVWSAGQGLQVFTNSLGQVRTNIMGEVRKQTVFQRVPVFTGGALTGWKLQVLYSKEHRVE